MNASGAGAVIDRLLGDPDLRHATALHIVQDRGVDGIVVAPLAVAIATQLTALRQHVNGSPLPPRIVLDDYLMNKAGAPRSDLGMAVRQYVVANPNLPWTADLAEVQAIQVGVLLGFALFEKVSRSAAVTVVPVVEVADRQATKETPAMAVAVARRMTALWLPRPAMSTNGDVEVVLQPDGEIVATLRHPPLQSTPEGSVPSCPGSSPTCWPARGACPLSGCSAG